LNRYLSAPVVRPHQRPYIHVGSVTAERQFVQFKGIRQLQEAVLAALDRDLQQIGDALQSV
jgi:hypothetical protein